jgi:Tfp pilus assembly protein PilN
MTLTKSKSPKVSRSTNPATPVSSSTKRGAAAELLIVGGSPRVHLLPAEVLERKKARSLRRKLAVVLVLVLVAIGAGVGLATVGMISAQASLATAQAQSADLAKQRNTYSAITKVQTDVKSIQASQLVGTSQEIDWQPYIASLQATLPANTKITAISASIDLPIGSAPAGGVTTNPLEGPRLATVQVTVVTPQASIADWLTKLPALPGFVDAEPTSVNINQSGSNYTVVVEIHVSDAALSKRFVSTK